MLGILPCGVMPSLPLAVGVRSICPSRSDCFNLPSVVICSIRFLMRSVFSRIAFAMFSMLMSGVSCSIFNILFSTNSCSTNCSASYTLLKCCRTTLTIVTLSSSMPNVAAISRCFFQSFESFTNSSIVLSPSIISMSASVKPYPPRSIVTACSYVNTPLPYLFMMRITFCICLPVRLRNASLTCACCACSCCCSAATSCCAGVIGSVGMMANAFDMPVMFSA